MTLGLDTSVIVRLLTGQPPELCAIARERLLREQQLGHRVVATDLALIEAFYAATHHYHLDPDGVRASLTRMLGSGLVGPEPGSGALAAMADTQGRAGLADRVIHERHRELGAVTLTLDQAQEGLPGAEYLLRK